MTKLTKRNIDALRPSKTDFVVWDNELPCFGLRVKASGTKSFLIQYRNKAGRSRRLTIGSYGRLTPTEARKQARQMLADVDRGKDPAEEKTRTRGVPFKELAARYLEEHATVKKKERSFLEDRRLLEKIIRPAFGSKPVDAITRQDVAKLHHRLRGTPIQANRVLALLGKMFSLAEQWGLRTEGNPCRQIQKYKERKRERYLSAEELARLGQALSKAEVEGRELPSVFTAIRLLVLTGCRLSEILGLKWEHVDTEISALRLPDSKTGSRLVPLGLPALEVLQNAPRMKDNPYVCFGVKPGAHLVGVQKAWERIRKAASLEDVRLHDLRHSFASVGAWAGMSLPVIGALLGHKEAATTARYAHLAVDPLQRAANEISGKIAEAMKQKPRVVQMNR